ncbi:MAG: DUF3450 domain-containing protein [Salinisphaera sp.]|nr:DUF3450 domain-containing protein [Salinisphaera sp.]MDN5938520.1 DUF3450 domain-containing protein [Salinisphaera sp.]
MAGFDEVAAVLKILGVAGILGCAIALAAVAAAPELPAVRAAADGNRADAASQKRIDALSDDTRQMFESYRQTITKTQQLKVYNRELEKIVTQARARKAALAARLDDVTALRKQIKPLLKQMIGRLERSVDAGLPFLLDQRKQAIAGLRQAMTDPQRNVAERLRLVLNAYRAEAQYGRKLATRQGELTLDRRKTPVEFLRLGRLMLFYVTADDGRAGYWDRQAQSWKPLPGRYLEAVRTGIRIAKGRTAPQLITLPVPAPGHAGQPSPGTS